MDKPRIVGISGKKRHGKDSVCLLLQQINPGATLRLAFADALKNELCCACKVSPEFMEMHKDAFRLGLQWWGTEFRRGLFGDDYWINQAHEKLNSALARCTGIGPMVVFTDVRFPNEYDFIKKVGGKVVRVVRSVPNGAPPVPVDNHPSEIALDGYEFDYYVCNDGTLENLRASVGVLYTRLCSN